jgi:hypothetical protein
MRDSAFYSKEPRSDVDIWYKRLNELNLIREEFEKRYSKPIMSYVKWFASNKHRIEMNYLGVNRFLSIYREALSELVKADYNYKKIAL